MTAIAYLSFLKELSQYSKEYEQAYLDFEKDIEDLKNKIKTYIDCICKHRDQISYKGSLTFWMFNINLSFYTYYQYQQICVECEVNRIIKNNYSYIGKMRYNLNNDILEESIKTAVSYFVERVLCLERI